MATAQDVLAIAKGFVDKKYVEGRDNDTVFGRWWGANHQPWCAMFVSYSMNKAGAGPLIKGAQTAKGYASCRAGVAFFRKKKAWFAARDAQPGDHVFFDWELNGDPDHVGLVVRNDPKKKVLYTYEGNTSSGNGGSQSNGEGAYYRKRPYHLVFGIGRPAYAKTAPAKAPVVPAAPAPVEPPKAAPAPKAPAPKAPAPKAPTKLSKVYVVKAGDSYWAIAEKHLPKGLTVAAYTKQLQRLNRSKALHPGDRIKL